MLQITLLLCGEGFLHEGRRRLPCFVDGLGRRGAQAAPVWDAACLVVVVSWHWPAAQDVLQCPEDSTCLRTAEDSMNTGRAFQMIQEGMKKYFSKFFLHKKRHYGFCNIPMLQCFYFSYYLHSGKAFSSADINKYSNKNSLSDLRARRCSWAWQVERVNASSC